LEVNPMGKVVQNVQLYHMPSLNIFEHQDGLRFVFQSLEVI
jgi:hypothetical protein